MLVQLLGQETRRLGITIPQAHLLRQLRRREACTAAMVGEILGITSGPVTSITRRLERRGLIHRRRDRTDRRVVWFSLTEAGNALLDRFVEDSRGFWRLVFADLGEDAGQSAIDGLRVFAQSLVRAQGMLHGAAENLPEEGPKR